MDMRNLTLVSENGEMEVSEIREEVLKVRQRLRPYFIAVDADSSECKRPCQPSEENTYFEREMSGAEREAQPHALCDLNADQVLTVSSFWEQKIKNLLDHASQYPLDPIEIRRQAILSGEVEDTGQVP